MTLYIVNSFDLSRVFLGGDEKLMTQAGKQAVYIELLGFILS